MVIYRETSVEILALSSFECVGDGPSKFISHEVAVKHRKGLAMDDTTWDSCPGSIPISWPATSGGAHNKVGNVRIFRSASKLKSGMNSLRQFLVHNSGKAL